MFLCQILRCKDIRRKSVILQLFVVGTIASFFLIYSFQTLEFYFEVKKTQSNNFSDAISSHDFNRSYGKGLKNITHEYQQKKILFWTPFYREMALWDKVFLRHKLNECPESRCHLMTNKSAITEADAVIFNANDLEGKVKKMFEAKYELPPKKTRSSNQVYVFFTLEPPPQLSNIDLDKLSNYFNWTMTYRRDSDIFVPYGKVTEIGGKNSLELINSRPENVFKLISAEDLAKKEMAIWMVSHCHTQSKREEFVEELQKFISVNVFGSCGPKKCGKRTTLAHLNQTGKDPCEDVIRNHVFYLALENALCTDYVTEKLYRSLTIDVIPVVLGGPDYSLFAPPHSYIDAKDFDTIEDLAKYMQKVANNVDLFNEYFKWKEIYNIEVGHPYKPFICGLCEKLHSLTEESPHKSYKDIHKWYVKDIKCYNWFENILKDQEKTI